MQKLSATVALLALIAGVPSMVHAQQATGQAAGAKPCNETADSTAKAATPAQAPPPEGTIRRRISFGGNGQLVLGEEIPPSKDTAAAKPKSKDSTAVAVAARSNCPAPAPKK